MKAIRYYGPKKSLKLEDITRPEPGPGEVLVRVRTAGLCHTDLHFLSGLLNLGIAPMTLGHEIAGVIEIVGPGVERPLVGTRVIVYYYSGCGECEHCLRGNENLCLNLRAENGFITDGGFAEYIKVPARNAVPLPDNITYEMAAPIGCSVTTAVHACGLASVHRGQSVLVYGMGGIGFGLVQLCHIFGAEVIAVSRTPTKLAMARTLGADHTVNAHDDDVPERVRELTGGKGVDVIFELVATKETMDTSVQCLGRRATLMFIGYSQDSFTVHPIPLVVNEARVMGSVGNTLAELYESVRLVSEGKIKTIVDHVLPLNRYQEAIDDLSAGKPVGRIILTP
jgi:propanol-preferring alcohol dehydrogenase